MSVAGETAADLLDVEAVFLRPQEPFTWASGIRSPIYCDNRLILSDPKIRKRIEVRLAKLIQEVYPDVEVLMGTATAGIPHAALVAEILELPMGYVRSGAKAHGRGKQVEGRLQPGQKVVVVEDLISTGGSVLDAVAALRSAGANVLGIAALFTYGMQKAKDRFAEANVECVTLSNLDALVEVAVDAGLVSEAEAPSIIEFRDDPAGWEGARL